MIHRRRVRSAVAGGVFALFLLMAAVPVAGTMAGDHSNHRSSVLQQDAGPHHHPGESDFDRTHAAEGSEEADATECSGPVCLTASGTCGATPLVERREPSSASPVTRTARPLHSDALLPAPRHDIFRPPRAES